jgi:Fe2+ transport system protein FeoA
VEVVRVAPLGDPIMIDVGGYQVSLRRAEARGLYLGSDPDDVGRSTAESVA